MRVISAGSSLFVLCDEFSVCLPFSRYGFGQLVSDVIRIAYTIPPQRAISDNDMVGICDADEGCIELEPVKRGNSTRGTN